MADLTRVAQILAEDWERSALATRALGLLEDRAKVRPFIADWPALVRWRDRVLAQPRRHPPDIVAAALEALALECHLAGRPELADKAMQHAERIVLEHVQRSAPSQEYAPEPAPQ